MSSYQEKHTPRHGDIKSYIRSCDCSLRCVGRTITGKLPFIPVLRHYNIRRDLLADCIAGLTVGIMHIPQGMAYSQVVGLPPVYGLYASFFPVILYFFLGSSMYLSMGTFALSSIMLGSAITKGMQSRNLVPQTYNTSLIIGGNLTYQITDNSDQLLDEKIKIAMAVTLAVGIIQTILGILRLGFITVYLSDPLISGFTTAAIIHVFISQMGAVFGISAGKYTGPFKLGWETRDYILSLHKTNPVTLIISIACILILWLVKECINVNPKIKPKLKMPVPIELIVVIVATIISYFAEFNEKYKVKVVGDIPIGIPPPNLKPIPYLADSFSDAIAIAIVNFAISISMAKIFSKRYGVEADPNQELLAYGICNIIPAFFTSFVSTISIARSLVQEDVGARTQVTGLLSSLLVLVVLLVVGPYFKSLPNCVLAAIILVSIKSIFYQFLELKILWKVSFLDFAVWVVTFLATVFLDIDIGLLTGVLFALLTVIIKSQRPHSCMMGQMPGTDIYRNKSHYPDAQELPHIKIYRFDSAIFFANAEFFKLSLYERTVDPIKLTKLKKKREKQKKKEDQRLSKIQISMSSSDVKMNGNNSLNLNGQVSSSDLSRKDNQYQNLTSRTESEISDITKLPLTDIKFIIIDCSMMGYVDFMGIKYLQQVVTELKPFNITVLIAHCTSKVRDMFETMDFYKVASKNFIFVTLHDAVVHAQAQILAEKKRSTSHPTTSSNTSLTDLPGSAEVDEKTNL
ncbi:solute carrier family 26 member 6-like [Physella acuta]|uniref:solute carrier family 26 member 6-like n=1 Tax=Physella acuta TaxID=109671 RepID=UPI0027DAC589|nr:solute carrier family 26 member 6-like [Physella acuta]